MKLTSLTNLKELSLDRYARTSDPVESFYLQRLSSTNLIPVYNAHLDLRQYTGYSLSERKATLETVIGTYQRVLSDSLAIQDTNPGLQRAEYQQLFAERLRDVINDAQTDLAEVMREEQALVPAAVVRIDQRQKPAGQRTFKTRDKETLIGTARPQAAGLRRDHRCAGPAIRPVGRQLQRTRERGRVGEDRSRATRTARVIAQVAVNAQVRRQETARRKRRH